MSKIEIKELVKAGVHFGHLTRKWNPNMSPYIYSEKNGIHIINLYKTVNKLEEACNALEKIASSGQKYYLLQLKSKQKISYQNLHLRLICHILLKDGLVVC